MKLNLIIIFQDLHEFLAFKYFRGSLLMLGDFAVSYSFLDLFYPGYFMFLIVYEKK